MRASLIPILFLIPLFFTVGCREKQGADVPDPVYYPANTLNYIGTPTSAKDRSTLAFSDEGAWFAFGFPTNPAGHTGFTGPFLMTQGNGVWSSEVLSQLKFTDAETGEPVDWQNAQILQNGFPSHLQQEIEIEDLKLSQTLFYISPHSAIITSRITNTSSEKVELHPHWKGKLFPIGARIESGDKGIGITFSKSPSRGVVQALGSEILNTSTTDSTYDLRLEIIELAPGESRELILAHSFYFPPTNWAEEQSRIGRAADDPTRFLEDRINEKKAQLTGLCDRLDSSRMDTAYRDLLVKTVLTLQNNWRSPAGELTHSGLFPSYHQKWFHGYWAWDSWKHAVALGHCDPVLAREQIRAMYAFQKEDGFIPDCVFRDTTIENHNLRNTKPPLSAWAAWEVHRQSPDRDFLQELYPKIKKQHQWWYENRDHDGDRVCEYGSTDGSLVAAKWESGMDNAVRFDQSQLF